MRVLLLHSADALEPPADPVLEQLASALRSLDHTVDLLASTEDVERLVESLRGQAPHLVFNITESFAGRSALEANVAALLNLLGLRYTGSSPSGLMLAGDKSLSTQVLRFHGIRTPESATLYRGALDCAGNLHFPVIVKPSQEDASLGITASSVARDLKQLFARLDSVQGEFGAPVLVEEFVEGREFYVGLLGNAQAAALPIMELDFSGLPADQPRIASWNAKWGTDGAGSGAEFAGTKSVFPTDLPPELEQRICGVAVQAFEALRLRDYARVDLRVTPAGEVYVLEVNPNCYLARESEFARAASAAGLSYEALVGRIVELAMARYAR